MDTYTQLVKNSLGQIKIALSSMIFYCMCHVPGQSTQHTYYHSGFDSLYDNNAKVYKNDQILTYTWWTKMEQSVKHQLTKKYYICPSFHMSLQ